MYEIAIQPDDTPLRSGRRQSFSARWAELLNGMGHQVRLVQYRDRKFVEQLRGCDGFMWWFPHMPLPRRIAVRIMLALDHVGGIPIFPDGKTVWHFDDKIAQTCLLQAAGIPTPDTCVLWRSQYSALECARLRREAPQTCSAVDQPQMTTIA